MKIVGNRLLLGNRSDHGPVVMTPDQRAHHTYVAGSTGSGKSKLLESVVRQDILSWPTHRSSTVLLDPHGGVVTSLLHWLAYHRIEHVPVVILDFTDPNFLPSYNPFRERPGDAATIIAGLVEAVCFVWGKADMKETPLLEQWTRNTFWALLDQNLTLRESLYLMDRTNPRLRTMLTANLRKDLVAKEWAYANYVAATKPMEFEAMIGSTARRLRSFLENSVLERMFGQSGPSFDWATAIRQGWVVLVNLGLYRGLISEAEQNVVTALMLSDLWLTARQINEKTGLIKPCRVIIDEFQKSLVPSIAGALDQARGLGIWLLLASQFPRQVLTAPGYGRAIYDSLMNNARSKLSFALEDVEEATLMAQMIHRGRFDPRKIRLALTAPTVVGHDIIGLKSNSRSRGHNRSLARQDSEAFGETTGTISMRGGGSGRGRTVQYDGDDLWQLTPQGIAESEQENELFQEGVSHQQSYQKAWSKTDTAGTSESATDGSHETLRPIIRERLSSVQFEPLADQFYEAGVGLADQRRRWFMHRLFEAGSSGETMTPFVRSYRVPAKWLRTFIGRLHRRWSFIVPQATAAERLQARRHYFEVELLAAPSSEPVKRRVKG